MNCGPIDIHLFLNIFKWFRYSTQERLPSCFIVFLLLSFFLCRFSYAFGLGDWPVLLLPFLIILKVMAILESRIILFDWNVPRTICFLLLCEVVIFHCAGLLYHAVGLVLAIVVPIIFAVMRLLFSGNSMNWY